MIRFDGDDYFDLDNSTFRAQTKLSQRQSASFRFRKEEFRKIRRVKAFSDSAQQTSSAPTEREQPQPQRAKKPFGIQRAQEKGYQAKANTQPPADYRSRTADIYNSDNAHNLYVQGLRLGKGRVA